MATTTRRAVTGDAAALHDLAARTFALACPPGTEPADIDAFVRDHLSRRSFERYLADERRVVLLAEVEGRPAGYAMLVAGPAEDPQVRVVVGDDSIELSKFYLLAENHGSGVAAALMEATVTAATATGAPTCWLGVNQQNARAARFYGRHGFDIVGVKRFLVGEQWHDDHIRLRRLVAPPA